ncbi:MAG TPA: Dabb family protein [Symbiobacteriaceae bacterium]|nr:Dabb family protein [Symbiobacteriaceae bacterium]
MVEHIVCFKLKPEITAQQEQEFIEMLRGLKGKIPAIVDLSAGRNFSPERGQGFTVGLVVRFNDKAGLATYGPHEHHQPVKARVGEICESVLAVDYEF